jgi:hypothetical protein
MRLGRIGAGLVFTALHLSPRVVLATAPAGRLQRSWARLQRAGRLEHEHRVRATHGDALERADHLRTAASIASRAYQLGAALLQGMDPQEGAGLPAHERFFRLRASSYDEYAAWYLTRENAKWGDHLAIPSGAEERAAMMQAQAPGKLRSWFPEASWTVQLVETPEALAHLMMLDADVTRRERLVRAGVPRLLGWGVRHARETRYLLEPAAGRERHHAYYRDIAEGRVQLRGENRLVLITMDEERSQVPPTVKYYLHDGFGRALPYLTLVDEGKIPFSPVEAFVAERR